MGGGINCPFCYILVRLKNAITDQKYISLAGNYKHIGLFSVRHHWIMDYPPPMASFLTPPPQFLACKIFDLWEVNQNLRDLDQNLWDFDRSFRDLDQILRFEPTSVRFGSMSLRFRSKSLIYGQFAKKPPTNFAKMPPLQML